MVHPITTVVFLVCVSGLRLMAQTAPICVESAGSVQGIGARHCPTADLGLTLKTSAGTAMGVSAPTFVTCPDGTLTKVNTATHQVLLDRARSCVPTVSQAPSFASGQIPNAEGVASGGSVMTITDAPTSLPRQSPAAHPSGHSLVERLNGIRFADQFLGASANSQAQAACSSFGTSSGLVILPSSMSPGTLSAPASNCQYLDLRGSSSSPFFQLISNPTPGTAGGAGLEVIVGSSSLTNANPASTDSVAGYFAAADGNGRNRVWGLNPLVYVAQPGSSAWGLESDLNCMVSCSGIGADIVSGGTVSPTIGLRTTAAPFGAAWQSGYVLNAISGSGIYFAGATNSVQTTQPITSTGSQTFTTNYNPTTQSGISIGSWVSLDAGANQEDVTVTSIAGGSLTATVAKTHATGVQVTPYVASTGIDFAGTIVKSSIFTPASIQAYVNAGKSNTAPFIVLDRNGATRAYEFWNSSNQHVYQDIGNGWMWNDINSNKKLKWTIESGSLLFRDPSATDAWWLSLTPAASGGGITLFGGTNGVSSPVLKVQGQTQSTGIASAVNVVSYSTTPTFNLQLGNVQQFSCTTPGAAISPTVTNLTKGMLVTVILIQNGTNPCTLTWPANVHGGMTVSATLSSINVQTFIVSNGGTDLYATGPGSTGITGGRP